MLQKDAKNKMLETKKLLINIRVIALGTKDKNCG